MPPEKLDGIDQDPSFREPEEELGDLEDDIEAEALDGEAGVPGEPQPAQEAPSQEEKPKGPDVTVSTPWLKVSRLPTQIPTKSISYEGRILNGGPCAPHMPMILGSIMRAGAALAPK